MKDMWDPSHIVAVIRQCGQLLPRFQPSNKIFSICRCIKSYTYARVLTPFCKNDGSSGGFSSNEETLGIRSKLWTRGIGQHLAHLRRTLILQRLDRYTPKCYNYNMTLICLYRTFNQSGFEVAWANELDTMTTHISFNRAYVSSCGRYYSKTWYIHAGGRKSHYTHSIAQLPMKPFRYVWFFVRLDSIPDRGA